MNDVKADAKAIFLEAPDFKRTDHAPDWDQRS
jgi:hypothetical protein